MARLATRFNVSAKAIENVQTDAARRKVALATMKKTTFISAYILATALLGACASTRLPGVHRIDIQQGNILTQDMVRQLSPGMEERQVRLLLGTPLVVNPFDPNRWDYLYTLREGNGRQTRQMLSVYFRDDKLVRVAGDIRALEEDKEPDTAAQSVVTVPNQHRDRGVFGWVARILGMDEADSRPRDDEPMPAVKGAAAAEDSNRRVPIQR
jgi:outer membrane protein assembly factor BamE